MDFVDASEPKEEASEVASTTSSPAEQVAVVKKRRRNPSGKSTSEGIEPLSSRPTDPSSCLSVGSRSRINEEPAQTEERLEKMRYAIRTLIECMGEDPDREGLRATPSRYAKALLTFTEGYQKNLDDIVNNALFHEKHNDLVVVNDIDIHSFCEHHMVPFTGKMHIGYLPSDALIGLSKLPRIAEMFSRRLQIQERLTSEVAQSIMGVLKPQGVIVVMESSHLCMVMRGVEKTSATTVTRCVLGCFKTEAELRTECLGLLGNRRT